MSEVSSLVCRYQNEPGKDCPCGFLICNVRWQPVVYEVQGKRQDWPSTKRGGERGKETEKTHTERLQRARHCTIHCPIWSSWRPYEVGNVILILQTYRKTNEKVEFSGSTVEQGGITRLKSVFSEYCPYLDFNSFSYSNNNNNKHPFICYYVPGANFYTYKFIQCSWGEFNNPHSTGGLLKAQKCQIICSKLCN